MIKRFLAASTALMGASAFATGASAPAAAASAVTAATAAEVGFMAGLFGFIAGWAFVILGVLALFGIIAEANDSRGWSVFWLIVAAVLAYFTFHLSWMTLLIGAVAYVTIGLIWSFWRYKRFVSKKVEENRESSAQVKERVLAQIHPKAMVGTITAWILIWPFSMVENLLGDFITAIQSLITKWFRGVYHRVYESAVAALK